MSIIVILPTYKEAENLKILIPQLLEIKNLSVLVVDDSSPDDTKKIIDDFQKEFPNKIFLFQRKERGRATAGIFGFKKSLEKTPDYIAEMDADLSHRADDLKKLISEMKNCDVSIGSRFVKGGKDLREQRSRHIISNISRKTYKIITGLKIEDIGSGFKCYKSNVVKKLLETTFLSEVGSSVCLEINFKLIKLGFKVNEVPIEFADRIHGASKINWRSFIEPITIALKLINIYGRV